MKPSFIQRLQSGHVLVADGATGTNLQVRGLPPGASPETWIIEQPEQVLGLHQAFIDAGSDLILTCTFGGNRMRLASTPYAEQVDVLNQRAVKLAQQAAEAAEHDVYVAGSMGPTGHLMAPYGTLQPEEVTAIFAEQASALASAGADVLVLETFSDLEEIRAAVKGVQQVSTLPLVCSFSYDRGGRTMMGVGPDQMAAAIAPLGVVAIGANCGTTLENMEAVVHQLAAQETGRPLWIKPNAGLPEGSPPVYTVTPEAMAVYAVRFAEGGARIIGGCCGSTPAHIRAIASALSSG